MAHKKKTVLRKRRATMSAPKRTRRTRRARKGKGLSELFNPTTATAAARAIGSGAIGGTLAGGLLRVMKNRPVYERLGAGVAASFVVYALAGYPNMAAGMIGGIAAVETQPMLDKFMGESLVDYADVDALNSMPSQVMSEDGEMLTLAEVGGEMVYLNEDEQTELAEMAYLQEGIYPNYSTQY